MTAKTPDSHELTNETPLTNFSNCHVGILEGLSALGELPALLGPAARARQVSAAALALFNNAVFEHHSEEENELFPAVLASAQPGEELQTVRACVERLTTEHRELEALWKRLEPSLKRVAMGQAADLDIVAVDELVKQYAAHAAYEEVQFLPLSQSILSRNANHLSALGLSIHLRHVKVRNPYI